MLKDTVVRQNPDAIIIDDNVNGTNGDTLSFRIKTDKMIGYIPVVLLIRAFDNESYLSHLGSGADRLELRIRYLWIKSIKSWKRTFLLINIQ